METDLRIDGANCPTCLDATTDVLRGVPGVTSVGASILPGCVAIEHGDEVDVAILIATVRERLHRVTMASAEIVMESVDPVVMNLNCAHHGSHHG